LSKEGRYVQLQNLEDLVKMTAGSPTAFIHHLEHEKKHIYFISVIFGGGGSLTYYVKLDEEVGKKYITFNSVNGRIEYRENFAMDANVIYVPIIEVKTQNVLPLEILT
jgi:hypothetical protein